VRQKSGSEKEPAEDAIKDIRRAARRHFSAEEKIRVVLEGLRGEDSIPPSDASSKVSLNGLQEAAHLGIRSQVVEAFG
jgi:hypothetical protein